MQVLVYSIWQYALYNIGYKYLYSHGYLFETYKVILFGIWPYFNDVFVGKHSK